MKVLFIAPHFPVPANSGGAIATLETLRSIHSLCDLHLLVPPPDSEHTSRLAELRRLLPNISLHFYRMRETEPKRFQMYKTGVMSALTAQSYWAFIWTNPKLRLAVVSLAAQHRYDIVHCEWLRMAISLTGLDLPLLIRALDVHFVGMRQWADSLPPSQKLRRSFWQTQAERFRRVEAATLASAPMVVTLSAEDEAVLRREGVSHTVTIPPPRGLEPEAIPFQLNGPRRALFLGRLEMPVNREAFFVFANEIWPHVSAESRARVKPIIAGGFPDEEVRRRATECNFEIHGTVSDQEARELFAKTELFLSPVVSGTGIKIKTIEAMANSKPIIGFAAAFRGVPVEHGVHALIASSAKEFAQWIEMLSLDPLRSREIGLAAREFVRLNYDPTTLAARLISVYAETAEKYRKAHRRRMLEPYKHENPFAEHTTSD